MIVCACVCLGLEGSVFAYVYRDQNIHSKNELQKYILFVCFILSRRSVEKIGDLGPNAGKLLLFIKSKANRLKQNNNQQRDTPDGNVVLVSRVHETECNRSDRKYSEHTYMHM